MGDFIMILNLLSAINVAYPKTDIETIKPAKTLEHIAQGMSKKELIKAFGKPSRTESVHNFYSGVDSVRYFYEDEPCIFSTHSCTIDLVNGKIASYRDVKDDLIE